MLIPLAVVSAGCCTLQDSNNKSFFGRWSGSTAAGGDVGNGKYVLF